MKVRKKPVIVEAVRFIGWNKEREGTPFFQIYDSKIAFSETPLWLETALSESVIKANLPYQWCIYVHTLEGDMRADEGDYIIKGVNGEIYPCKPDIFEKTYESID